NEGLRKRYEELRDAGAPITAAFDAPAEKAPLPRLRAALPLQSAPRAASRPFAGITLRELAACIVSFLLRAGAAAWIAMSVAPRGDHEDWHAAVVGYTNLYTNETFSPLHPDAALQAVELSAVGARVGAPPDAREPGAPGPAFHGSIHALFRRLAVGRDRLCG